jgi:ATP-dependent DNA helicase RecG
MLNEGGTDFTASVCSGLTMDDLDPDAIEEFRRRWTAKSGSSQTAMTREQLLRDVDVFIDEGLTYAALILFGLPKAVSRHLPQCEIIYEYRATDASGPAQQRREYRRGFFAFQDELWGLIEARNDLSHFQDGLFVFDIPTFDERSVREALLNAISHRDYQLGGSIFVRQRPRRLSIESPGGLPLGITVDNIYDRQNPRNRRICEVLSRCGLVERAGQGMNLIFEQCIQQGKQPPDFTGTDQYQVVLSLDGRIQDPRFVTFMQKVGSETATSFSTDDFLVLSLVHQEKRVPDALSQSVRKLVELGVIERIGRGRSASCILSRRFYSALGKTGVHTRKRHLDRETNKELLVREIVRKRVGCRISELQSVIPYLSRSQIARLLNELREARRVKMVGIKKGAKWLPGSQATHESKKRKSSASYSRK